jgi:hypothetical protein
MHHQVTEQTPSIVAWPGVHPSISTLTAPRGVPSAPSSTQACTSYKGEALLPSYISTACNSSASCVDCPGTSVSWCTAPSCEGLEGAVVRSPALIADGTARGKHGGITRHAADQRMIRAIEV